MAEQRLVGLDVLRGCAVVLVLIRHMPGADSGPLAAMHAIGWSGVDLFFVLSGFLISGLLFAEIRSTGQLRLGRFLTRRGFKIYPAYFVAYLAFVAFGPAALSDVPINAAFIQNFMPAERRWPHSWSIAVEEHFYIGLPLMLLGLVWLARRVGVDDPLRWVPVVTTAACVLALLLRLGVAHPRWSDLYYPTQYRVDALAFGVLLGYLHHSRQEAFVRVVRRMRVPLIVMALAVLALVSQRPLEQSSWTPVFGFAFLYLAYGALVCVGVAVEPARPGLATRTTARVGVYSYTIYLAHAVVLELPGIEHARGLFDRGSVADQGFYLAAAGAGGVLLARTIERPALRLRSRWAPSDAPTIGAGRGSSPTRPAGSSRKRSAPWLMPPGSNTEGAA